MTTAPITFDTLSGKLPEYAEAIHAANKAKGFWPENVHDRDLGEAFALVVSELSEALEEDRAGRPPLWYAINGVRVYRVTDGTGADWTTDPDGYSCATNVWSGVAAKPEGAAVEAIDAAIRLLDLLCVFHPHMLESRGLAAWLDVSREAFGKARSLGAKIMYVTRLVSTAAREADVAGDFTEAAAWASHALVACLELVIEIDPSLDPFVVMDEKLAYNQTRAHKHGKAY